MTVTFDRIRIAPGAILIPVPFTLYYKLLTDTSWTLIDSNVYVDVDGYILASPLPNITIVDAGYYVFRAVNDYCGVDYQQQFIISDSNLFEWVEDEFYCEGDLSFNVSNDITGLADPHGIGYDSVTGRIYVADLSAITSGSNVYWFDPNTISVASDVQPVGAINKSVHVEIMDMEDRKIYLAGSDTGGLIKYDIAANTTSLLACGIDVGWPNYNRISLTKGDDFIVLVDAVAATVFIIDAITFTISNSVLFSSIPSYTQYFSKGSLILWINNEWWVLASQDSNLGANGSGIARYNSDFSSLIGVVSLPGQVTWTNSAYWRSGKVIDGKLYILDCGSNQILSVDLDSLSVSSLYVFTNKQGKSHIIASFIVDPITMDVFIAGAFSNDVNTDSSPIPISYKLDRVTFNPDYIYPNLNIGNGFLARQGTSSKMFGTYSGITVYSQINPAVAPTDGGINVFDNSIAGNYTGTKIVSSLQKIDSVTGMPVIPPEVKPNIPEDPNYIAPYSDLTTCPPTYTLLCPTATHTVTGSDAEYEFSVAKSTYNNPLLYKFGIIQVDTVTSAILNSVIVSKNLYQNGTLTKVGSNPNRVDLQFLNASNSVMNTCTGLFTF